MDNPRPDKVAVVDEVKARFEESPAALLTEYRGLDVAAISELRRSLTAAGGDYKVYKNTLVGFATRDLGLELDHLLTGPTAIAFITTMPDGSPGDAVNVAKVLKEFAKANPDLVVKGGVLGDSLLSAEEAAALADVAPREELLARFAGGLAAPLVQLAGLLQALPRNFAYGLAALIEQGGGVPEAETADAVSPEASDNTSPEASDNTDTAEAPEAEASTDNPEAAEADDNAEGDSPEADTADADSPEASDNTAAEADEEREA